MNLVARFEATVVEARPLLGDLGGGAQATAGTLPPAAAPSWTTPAPGHCETGALTNGLGLFVQLLLAFVAFSCLVAKRYCEPFHRRRTWAVWFLDTSKQIVGAGTMHAANVLLSEVLYAGDPCTWYVINFMMDSTIGLGVIFIGLRIAFNFGQWMSWTWLKYGRYGNPPDMAVWAKQCSIYLVVIVVEKSLVFSLTLLPIWKRLLRYAMNWTTNADTEVVLVMFVIPLIVNAIIFWVVDNLLMQHDDNDDTTTSGSPGSHRLSISTTSRSRWRWWCFRQSCGFSRHCCAPCRKTAKYSRLSESPSPPASCGRSKMSVCSDSSEAEEQAMEFDSRGSSVSVVVVCPKCGGTSGSSNRSCSCTCSSSGDTADHSAVQQLPTSMCSSRQQQQLLQTL